MKSLLLKKPFHSEFSFLFIKLLLRCNWHLMEHTHWTFAAGLVTTHTHLRNHCCHRAWASPVPPRVCSGYVLSFAFSPSHPSLSPHPVPCKPPICSVAEDWFPCFRIFCGITEDVLFFFFLLSASFTQQNYFEIHACCCICPQSFLFCCRAVFCMDMPTTVYHSPARNVWSFLVWGY